MSDTVRSNREGKGDDRVLAATGRHPDDWYSWLDESDGRTIGHTAIAALVQAQGIDGWWAQSVAIGYEQSRGLRIPGQRSDGTFAVTASRTVDGAVLDVLERGSAAFTTALGVEPTGATRTGNRPSTRWTFPDRETVRLTCENGPRPETVRVSAERGRLTGPDRLADAKAELQALIAAL